MRRLALLAVLPLAASGCSRRAAANYRHCLRLRVGMTKEQLLQIMGEPETTQPYVEGQTLEYLKGRTAYEWSNPATMPEPDHVSVEDASGRVMSVRCSDVEIAAQVYAEPPAPSTAAARAAARPAR